MKYHGGPDSIVQGACPSPAELNELNAALQKINVAGDRYPEELEERTGL
jgi:hypothetical protein